MNKSILLIEDDPSTLEVYKIALEQVGFVVDAVDSGEEALEKVKKGKYDLVLLDYILPGVDGSVVLKEIRKNPRTKKMKVLITTNYSKEALKDKGKLVKKSKAQFKNLMNSQSNSQTIEAMKKLLQNFS